MKSISMTKLCMTAAFISTIFACEKDEVVPVILPSTGSSFSLNGGAGGSLAANSVFIDLSGDKADTALRAGWDLGFYCGDLFRVVLNNTNGGSAVKINKTDINAVSLADVATDTINLTAKLGTVGAFGIIDDVVNNDVTKTVISEVSATDANNFVYVVNPAGGTHSSPYSTDNFYKIRVLRKGTGYTLQYAKLSATTFQTIDVTKDAAYHFRHVSLKDNKLLFAQPQKANWDLQWTWGMYNTSMGGPIVPYSFSDLVFINAMSGVAAAEVLTSRVSYDNYSDSSNANTTFQTKWDVIGSKWRSTQPATGVRTDRFYVIRDAAGNVYKLKFKSMGVNDGGTRGKPEVEYKLVK